MDRYYSRYFSDFAPGRPYLSLIMSEMHGELAISGRVWWRGEWLTVDRIAAEQIPVRTWRHGEAAAGENPSAGRIARLIAAFGPEAAARLRRATVGVVGAGGTGSAAIEVLARAGVGRLIIIDPDHIAESNLERVHGSYADDVAACVSKVALARRDALRINPTCEVKAYLGSIPQEEIIEAFATADVALGCTDRQHSRLALSDLAIRYLVPSIDCGVVLEGTDGNVTGQIAQFVRFLAADPCALCRAMIVPARLAQELMPDDERNRRQEAAKAAHERGEDAHMYWHGEAQLNTVGYLTSAVGALAAGYAIGWLTGRFEPPFSRLQMNLAAPLLDVTDLRQDPLPECACRRIRGWADQGISDALITAPTHWPAPKLL
jgi:molybdopterin/thiamine biosynthesis adenylyltransferase